MGLNQTARPLRKIGVQRLGMQQPEVRLHQTIYYYLQCLAQRFGNEALLASGREPLTYGGLLHQIETTVEALNAAGVGRGDKVAIVLPQPDQRRRRAACRSRSGAVAPLRPGSALVEFAAYLSDLKVFDRRTGSRSTRLRLCRGFRLSSVWSRIRGNPPDLSIRRRVPKPGGLDRASPSLMTWP